MALREIVAEPAAPLASLRAHRCLGDLSGRVRWHVGDAGAGDAGATHGFGFAAWGGGFGVTSGGGTMNDERGANTP